MSLAILISTMRVQMKQSFARPMFRFCLIANPILNTILLYEMYRNSGEENFMAYVVLGAGLMGLWSCICFSSAGDKIIGNTLMSLLTLGISLVTAVILFRIPLTLESPLYFLLALVVAVISFVVISSVVACILTLSRKTELYMNLIEIPLILLCGFVFPVTVLPKAISFISYALFIEYPAAL